MTFRSPAERAAFIESNMPLVASRVMRLNRGMHCDDLFQAGCVGLILAVDMFDPQRGIAFSTLAVPYIDGYINKHKIKGSAIIRPLRRGSEYFYKDIISISAPANNDSGLSLADTLVSGVDIERDVVGIVCRDSFIVRLDDVEKRVFAMMLDGLQQNDIAKIMGRSCGGINKIVKRIRKKYEIDRKREETA